MTPKQIDAFCGKLPAATRTVQWEGVIVFKVGGKMFAGLHNDKMILRLSPDDCAQLLAQGALPFEPMPGRAMKGWVTVPRAVLDDARELNRWMEQAMEWTRGMAGKKK